MPNQSSLLHPTQSGQVRRWNNAINQSLHCYHKPDPSSEYMTHSCVYPSADPDVMEEVRSVLRKTDENARFDVFYPYNQLGSY